MELPLFVLKVWANVKVIGRAKRCVMNKDLYTNTKKIEICETATCKSLEYEECVGFSFVLCERRNHVCLCYLGVKQHLFSNCK